MCLCVFAYICVCFCLSTVEQVAFILSSCKAVYLDTDGQLPLCFGPAQCLVCPVPSVNCAMYIISGVPIVCLVCLIFPVCPRCAQNVYLDMLSSRCWSNHFCLHHLLFLVEEKNPGWSWRQCLRRYSTTWATIRGKSKFSANTFSELHFPFYLYMILCTGSDTPLFRINLPNSNVGNLLDLPPPYNP